MDKVIRVRVTAKSKKNEIRKLGDGFKVYLTAPPVNGKANKALLEVLADYFSLKKSQLDIVKGKKSKDKVVRIKGA